jgi:hypothetical protein
MEKVIIRRSTEGKGKNKREMDNVFHLEMDISKGKVLSLLHALAQYGGAASPVAQDLHDMISSAILEAALGKVIG